MPYQSVFSGGKLISPDKPSSLLDKIGGDFVPGQDYQARAAQAIAQGTVQPGATSTYKVPALPKAKDDPGTTTPSNGIFNSALTYARALLTDPGKTVNRVITGQGVSRVDNGAVISDRMPLSQSSKIKSDLGGGGSNGPTTQLDHTIPLEIGGTNDKSNLKLMPKQQDMSNSDAENYLGQALKLGMVNGNQATDIMSQYKKGYINDKQLVAMVKAYSTGPKASSVGIGDVGGAFKDALNKVIVQPAVGIAEGVAEQAGHAATELSASPLNVFTPKPQDVIEHTANDIQSQLIAGGMSKDKAQTIANQVRTKGYDQFLKEAGIGINDSPITIGRKAVGNIGGTVSNFLPVGQALKSTALIGRVIKSALFGATAGGVGNLASDNLTPQSEATAIGGGALVGGLLPAAAEGANSLIGKGVQAIRGRSPIGPVDLPPGISHPDNMQTPVSTAAKPPEVVPAPKPTGAVKPLNKSPEVNAVVDQNLVSKGAIKPEVATVPSKALTVPADTGAPVTGKSVSDFVGDIKAGRSIDPVVITRGKDGVINVDPESKVRLQAMERAGVTDIPVVEKGSGAVAPIAAPKAEGPLPEPLQKLQDSLPQGYKVSPTGDVIGLDGKELTTGQLQDLTQAPYLTEFEKASRENDVAAMNRIAKEHPGDNRVSMGSINKEPALKSLTKNIASIESKSKPQGSLPSLSQEAKAALMEKARKTAAAEAKPAESPAAKPQGKTEQVPELPKGYVQDESGAIFDPQGKVMKFGDVQKLAQTTRGEGYLTQFENASKAGDVAAMKKIAAEHPADERLKVPETMAPDIKKQIAALKDDGENYDANGNLTPEAAKKVTGLQKQLNALGERIPKAEKPVTVTKLPEKPAAAQPEIKTSKLADRVEAKAIKSGLSEAFGNKPDYAKVDMQQQAEAAAALLKSDPAKLIRIAMGQERPPEGLLPESAWVAAVEHATKTGDGALLRSLGTESSLVSEATGMGQRIRALGELSPTNPAKAIKNLQDARIKAAEKRSGKTIAETTSSEIKAIRAAQPKPTKMNWSMFVESIKC